mgnify:CR=1 FL=1
MDERISSESNEVKERMNMTDHFDVLSLPLPDEVKKAIEEILGEQKAKEQLTRISTLKTIQAKGGEIRLASTQSSEQKKQEDTENGLSDVEEYELFGYPHTEVQDCNFLENTFSTYSHGIRNVLDVACGTGRHALEMARREYNVTGVDISEDRLNLANKRASEQNLKIRFLVRDMTKLDFESEFDAAYVLFNSLSLITQNEDLIKFMNGIHRSLTKDGLLIVQVGNLWLYIAGNNFTNDYREANDEKNGIRRHRSVRTIIGPYNNIYCHRTEARYWRNGKELKSKAWDEPKRIFSMNEFDLLCRLTNFKILSVYGNTDVKLKIENPENIEDTNKDPKSPYHYYVVVLKRIDI